MPNPLFWHEDLDFCMLAKLLGYKILTMNKAPIKHKGGLGHDKGTAPASYYENARYVDKKHTSDNTLTIYRWVHENCFESYCVLSDNIMRVLRKAGWIVIRKPNLETPPISFTHCKAFEMKMNGRRFVLMHLENDVPPRIWKKNLETVLAPMPRKA